MGEVNIGEVNIGEVNIGEVNIGEFNMKIEDMIGKKFNVLDKGFH